MPNHVTNTIRIKGNIAKLFSIGFLSMEEEPHVDFNGIIPMPESLRIDSGSQQEIGRAALLGGDWWEVYRGYSWFESRYPGCDTPEKLADFLREHNPDAIRLAEQSIANEKLYGSTDWYRWAPKHWGTKWNAYDTSKPIVHKENVVEVRFTTAWDTPEPVFEKLREMGYRVDGLYHDEYDDKLHEIGEGRDHFSSSYTVTYDPWSDNFDDDFVCVIQDFPNKKGAE